jgi:uncharacterized protein YndB with AHSA1/START domain
MGNATTINLRVSRRFEATAERVFDAWLDPELACQFLFATPTGRMVRVEIDARVGGSFCIVERRGDVDAEHFGIYLVIDRPRRLVFTFATEKGAAGDRVSIDIITRGAGCELTLTHETKPEWQEPATRGWTMILDGLARSLGEPPS